MGLVVEENPILLNPQLLSSASRRMKKRPCSFPLALYTHCPIYDMLKRIVQKDVCAA